jgi:hypothetical protein
LKRIWDSAIVLSLFFILKTIFMHLQQAERKRAKIKMALQGPSGSGKTYSALLLAYGLCNDWTKIAVVDTENHSAELYANLGRYNTVSISAPYTPEKYSDAIHLCEQAQMKVIILDSISHEWDGSGGILDIHGNMTGNSFTNWSKLTPRHNAFVQAILQSNTHVIGTIRSKQDYVLIEKNNKMVPEKVGLKGVTRDGIDYEFTIVFDLDIKHNATTSKDRTGLFMDKPEFKICCNTGKKILEWCNQPPEVKPISDKEILRLINSCTSVDELVLLYKQHPDSQQSMLTSFTKKRQMLTVANDLKSIINPQNLPTNGTLTNQ